MSTLYLKKVMPTNSNGLYIGLGTAVIASTLAAAYASSVYDSKQQRRYAALLRHPIPHESRNEYIHATSPEDIEQARIDALSRQAFELAKAATAAAAQHETGEETFGYI